MRRAYCRDCARFEFRQAHEVEPVSLRPSLGELLTFAFIFAAYFMALAWAVSR